MKEHKTQGMRSVTKKTFLKDDGLCQRNVSFFSRITKTKGRTSVIFWKKQMAYIHVVTHTTTKATEARDTPTWHECTARLCVLGFRPLRYITNDPICLPDTLVLYCIADHDSYVQEAATGRPKCFRVLRLPQVCFRGSKVWLGYFLEGN
jgi:hypothetical protein